MVFTTLGTLVLNQESFIYIFKRSSGEWHARELGFWAWAICINMNIVTIIKLSKMVLFRRTDII